MLARIRWLPLTLLVAFGLLTLLAVACTPASSPIQSKLSMQGEPVVGKPFVLVLDISSNHPFSDVHAGINIPEGIESVDGRAEWQISQLEASSHYVFSTTAQVARDGYFTIPGYAQALGEVDSVDYLHIIVKGDDTWVSKRPPEDTWTIVNGLGASDEKPQLLQTELTMDGLLTADGLTEVSYSVTPQVDLANVDVGFVGFVGGLSVGNPQVTTAGENAMTLFAIAEEAREFDRTIRWDGAMKAGQTYTFSISLDVTDNGSSGLYAWVNERDLNDGHTIIGKLDKLDLQFYNPRWARTWQYYFWEVWIFLFEKLGF